MIALMLVLSVLFHTTTQLDEWFEDWSERTGDDYLSDQSLAEFHDMLERHPQLVHGYVEPQPQTTPITARGMGGNVTQWTDLILVYFPESSLSLVLCVMQKESGGNPNAYNSSSGASGLMQILASWADHFDYVPADLFDPAINLEIARALSDDSWYHWNPYQDGRCR